MYRPSQKRMNKNWSADGIYLRSS